MQTLAAIKKIIPRRPVAVCVFTLASLFVAASPADAADGCKVTGTVDFTLPLVITTAESYGINVGSLCVSNRGTWTPGIIYGGLCAGANGEVPGITDEVACQGVNLTALFTIFGVPQDVRSLVDAGLTITGITGTWMDNPPQSNIPTFTRVPMAERPVATTPTESASAGGGAAIGLPLPLGNVNLAQAIGNAIRVILGLTGSMALIMFIYGGFIYMTAAGAEERVTQGKKTIIWAILGLIAVFSAYAVVDFIIKGLEATK